MNDIDVSIIFVNYKTSYLVKDVIASIKEKSQGFSYELIVVDNSQDEIEYQKLLENKEATIIDAKGNLGFGKANNLGAKIAKGKYLYFLNTDTLLMNNAIYELKKFLDEHNDVSIVGSNLYTKEGKPNHSFVPFEKNQKNEKKLNSIHVMFKKRVLHRRIDFNFSSKPLEIKGYVCGASLMMRKEDFDKLGGFDKDIFMYAEESLLCYRTIHELNKKIYNVPSSQIIHFEGGSFKKKVSYNHVKTMMDGNVIYYQKAFGNSAAIQYLKDMIKSSNRKRRLAIILRNKEKQESFSFYIKVCNEKLNELNPTNSKKNS